MDADKLGILCPNCGARPSRVLWVRNQRGYRARRRECCGCGARFSTAERFVGGLTTPAARAIDPTYRAPDGKPLSPAEFKRRAQAAAVIESPPRSEEKAA